jgi:hypothetical protein
MKITMFNILIALTIFAVGLKQYTFRIQQSLKLIDNKFYKFIKKLCLVYDRHNKQKVCREKLRRKENCF